MTRVTYVKQGQGISKAGNQFFTVTLLIGEECVTCFVNAENFKKISNLKPVYKKEYMATFEVGARYGKLTAELVSLEDIK